MISTHVLDVARGVPAAAVAVTLHAVDGEARRVVASGSTDADGRLGALLAEIAPHQIYELAFDVGAYFARTAEPTFYDVVTVRFLAGKAGRYHVPLLLAPWGYSTYRGS